MNLDLMNQQQKWQMQEEQFGDVTGPNTAENLNLSIPTSEKYAMSNYPSSQNVVRKKNKKKQTVGISPMCLIFLDNPHYPSSYAVYQCILQYVPLFVLGYILQKYIPINHMFGHTHCIPYPLYIHAITRLYPLSL